MQRLAVQGIEDSKIGCGDLREQFFFAGGGQFIVILQEMGLAVFFQFFESFVVVQWRTPFTVQYQYI
jgi:hypothetical protein